MREFCTAFSLSWVTGEQLRALRAVTEEGTAPGTHFTRKSSAVILLLSMFRMILLLSMIAQTIWKKNICSWSLLHVLGLKAPIAWCNQTLFLPLFF